MANYFEDFDFTDFWEDSGYAKEKYTEEAPSDELIASVEQELGYKLPASYIWLMKRHNGGIPVNTCFPTEEPTSWAEDYVAITGIMGIGRKKTYSLCGGLGSRFMKEGVIFRRDGGLWMSETAGKAVREQLGRGTV